LVGLEIKIIRVRPERIRKLLKTVRMSGMILLIKLAKTSGEAVVMSAPKPKFRTYW
jgi:hypothetical protein